MIKPNSSFLGPFVHNIFGNDVSEDRKENLINSAGHTKSGEIVNMINALINIQRDLTDKNKGPRHKMKLNRNKHKVLNLALKSLQGQKWREFTKQELVQTERKHWL